MRDKATICNEAQHDSSFWFFAGRETQQAKGWPSQTYIFSAEKQHEKSYVSPGHPVCVASQRQNGAKMLWKFTRIWNEAHPAGATVGYCL